VKLNAQSVLFTDIGRLVSDLFLGIINIVRYPIDRLDGRVFISYAGCQGYGSKDSGDEDFDSIHDFIDLFDNNLFIINNV
jgi:hypothetical protein